MPHYRFTFLTALVIVLGYGLALLWPGDDAYIWGWWAMVCLPLLLAIFAWSAVRGAAPLDDRAFHRTLPAGDGLAFRRVLGSVALVPAGIALVVLIYCWKSGFGWRAQTLGLAMLTVPVMGALSVLGLTASLATSRSYSRIWPWLWILGMPVFSAAVMAILIEDLDPDPRPAVYFTHWRTIALAGAVLYPLIWWLIAARRRIVLGVVLATVLGMLFPWLYHYGDLGPDLNNRSAQEGNGAKSETAGRIHWTRKPLPPEANPQDRGIDMDHLVGIDGMEEGEVVLLGSIEIGKDLNDSGKRYLQNWEVIEGADGKQRWRPAPITASVVEGRGTVFGRNVIWSALAGRLPESYPARYWTESWGMNRSLEHPPRTVVLRPGANLSPEEQISDSSGTAPSAAEGILESRMKSQPWSVWAFIYRFDSPVMSFSVEKGGSQKLPGGGLVRVNPLKNGEERSKISIDLIQEDLWQADGPWPGNEPRRSPFDAPWCFLVDREMGETYMVDYLGWGRGSQVMLGNMTRFTFDAGSPDSPEMTRKLKRLPFCEIYVFWPRFVGSVPHQPMMEDPAGTGE